MNIKLKPDAQKFIEDQVRAGRFRSPDEVLAEAVNRMMIDNDHELDDATIAAINRAEAQLDRGEGIDFDRFAAEMRQRITAK
jgi:putative addiction module CopG family antidote